jgi:serine/threonine protein kinase
MRKAQQLRAGDPRHVGPYQLVGLLGEGGQGVVYQGVDSNGEPVAIKLLHARFSGDAKARARFAAELAHAGRVAAFCTARVLDAEVEGDRPYIVSEFVEGPSLSEVIATGRAPRGHALDRLAIATVTALAAIHEAGVVHRDFKASNVIMGADGPRVIDFGIARALDATGTFSSTVVGTPSYMAPEQISGGAVGPAADVFAWACTIAYASNGATPFGQDSIPAVMHRILHAEPDLGQMAGTLRGIVAACLAKDPARRPTAREILLRLLGGHQASATAETLLTEGARVSSSASRPATLVLPPDPAQGPQWQAPPPYGPPSAEHLPTRDLRHPPAPSQPPGVGTRPRKGRRVMARAVAAAAFFLGAVTVLSWAKLGVLQGRMTITIDNVEVTGLATIWGILTLVMAVAALAVAITDEFTQRLSAAWAAVPGGIAVLSIIAFQIRQQDLHTKHPNFGMLTIDDLRSLGTSFRISLAYGWYVALAMSVVLVALALISLLFRGSAVAGPSSPRSMARR